MRATTTLARVGCALAEGPLWWPEHDRVLWVDIMAGRVWALDPDGEPYVFVEHHEPVGAIALGDDDSLLGFTPTGVWRLAPGGQLLIANPEPADGLRGNDAKPDPAGRLVGGTIGIPEPVPGAATLWSFAGGAARPLVRDVTISNGLAWSADGSTLFFVDTPTGRIDAFDYDVATGDVANRRPVVRIDPADGSPDGMAIDTEGGLWVAVWGGAAVHRYSASGALTAVVELPTPYVTCPAFAGADLAELVVTTAAEPFGEDPPDGAGDVYVCRPGVAGAPVGRVRSV